MQIHLRIKINKKSFNVKFVIIIHKMNLTSAYSTIATDKSNEKQFYDLLLN